MDDEDAETNAKEDFLASQRQPTVVYVRVSVVSVSVKPCVSECAHVAFTPSIDPDLGWMSITEGSSSAARRMRRKAALTFNEHLLARLTSVEFRLGEVMHELRDMKGHEAVIMRQLSQIGMALLSPPTVWPAYVGEPFLAWCAAQPVE